MDYYKCEYCGKTFDEFEMDFRSVQIDKTDLCGTCRKKKKDVEQKAQERCERLGIDPDAPSGIETS